MTSREFYGERVPVKIMSHQDYLPPPPKRFIPVETVETFQPKISPWNFDSQWTHNLCDFKLCDSDCVYAFFCFLCYTSKYGLLFKIILELKFKI
jgi:hypothetical protein